MEITVENWEEETRWSKFGKSMVVYYKLRKANYKTAGEGECTRLFLSLLLGLWRKRAPARARPFSLSSVPFTFQASLLRSLHATGNTGAEQLALANPTFRSLEWVHLYKLPEETSTRDFELLFHCGTHPNCCCCFKVGTLRVLTRGFGSLLASLFQTLFLWDPRIRPALYTLPRELGPGSRRGFFSPFGHWGHRGQDFIK